MTHNQLPAKASLEPEGLTHQRSNSDEPEIIRLKHLFYARVIGSLTLLLIFSWLIQQSNEISSISLTAIFVLWFGSTLIQFFLFRFKKIITGNLLFQLSADLMLIGLMIYNTSGIISPLIFLLGVVIVIAGTQARVLVVLITAVLASVTYLSVIHLYANHHGQLITGEQSLLILLQVSLFFLTGGIMALIARRHANLQQEQQHTTIQNYRLQELHSQLMNAMQEGILILDQNLSIQDFNPSAAKIIGIPNSKHTKYNLYDFLTVPPEILSFMNNNNLDTIQTEASHQQQTLLITLTRLLEGKETWLMTIVNITETRKLERKLAEQDKLASIGQMAAMLAHEIRNPMQTISQAVELMGLQSPNSQLEHIITQEISRLNRLVSDMLDYASPLHPHVQNVEIKALIQTSITGTDLTNQYRIQSQVPNSIIQLDPDHFRLVLDNLLRNAIFFSPTPESVNIIFIGHTDNWTLRIRDHGEGLGKEMRKTLFEPFQTGRKQGTGLGLATAWQACQVNQWSILIDEHIQNGTCFIIRYKKKMQSRNGEQLG